MSSRAIDPDAGGHTLKVKKIGNSVGLILPKELLARLQIKEGDTLHVIEAPDRELRLSPYDSEHEKALQIAREIMHDYADTLRALAK
jgi:putative addiction module antidote